MTDRAVIETARAALGIRGAVYVRHVSEREIRAAEGIRPRAAYKGTDASGAHCVVIVRGLRGIARIYALAHECVHAAQAEQLGGAAKFASAYRQAGAWHRETYRKNRYERDAQARGAEIAAEIAAGMEGNA